jgi:hypothetical protein
MLQDHPHAIHFKHILYFGEGHGRERPQLSWIERLPSKRSCQFQSLHPIVLTINVSNKSGHLLFAQS